VAGCPTDAAVWDALRSVSDPEYPLSIVDLGMVYAVRVAGGAVHVDMTFTSIGCPAIDMLVHDVQEAVTAVPAVTAVTVEVVWDPPWTRDCITDRGRRVLAMYGVVS
jgi:phenylacetate-CoA oxygenase PaaJ subunit